jgi:hypothetical protein
LDFAVDNKSLAAVDIQFRLRNAAHWQRKFWMADDPQSSVADSCIVTALGKVVAHLQLVIAPTSSLAVLAEKSSDRAKKIFVRNVWSKVRQVSPGSADFKELMLCVAMMGMHFGWRERLKDFSSPDLGDSGELAVDDIDYVAGFRDGLLDRAERARVACVF